jgi:hypothetical protein
MTGPNAGNEAAAPAGWYPEPGSGRQRYWTGTHWSMYAPPPPADPDEGRTLMIVGYVLAGTTFLFPLLGLPGLIIGIITATKPRRSTHGAAIIVMSVVLSVLSIWFWTDLIAT